MSSALRALDVVPASAAVTVGLVGGYATARATGDRPLGGAVLAAAGAVAAHRWWHRGGPATTVGLAALYVLGFGASHPLARRIGAWPSVLAVTAVNAAAGLVLVDRGGRAAPCAAPPTAARERIPPPSGVRAAGRPHPGRGPAHGGGPAH